MTARFGAPLGVKGKSLEGWVTIIICADSEIEILSFEANLTSLNNLECDGATAFISSTLDLHATY